jgi:DNA-binding protein HU-beta
MAAASSKRLTQTEIINQLAEKSGMKKSEAKELFNALADLAISEVKKNGEFTLPGFGKLIKANRKAREGRNPATGDSIKIPAKTTVKFRFGKAMKDAVSSLQGDPTTDFDDDFSVKNSEGDPTTDSN